MRNDCFCFLALAVLAMIPCASRAETQMLPDGPLVELSFYDGETELDSGHAWSIEEDELTCSGNPRGYLILAENVSDYTLTLEWKWDSDDGGNTGVLVHALPATSGFRTWPSCIEVQLQAGMAGDLYAIGQLPGFVGEGSMFVAPGLPVTRLDRKQTVEKPAGEWNTLEIIAQGSEMTIIVNGQTVNEISKVEPSKGAIALQSEGAPVRFRNIQLKQ